MGSFRRRVLIIGGTAAGTSVAAAIARNSDNHEVILFEQEPHIAVASCSIPSFIAGNIEDYQDLISYDPVSFSKRYGVSVRAQHRVSDISTTKRTVSVEDQAHGTSYEVRYDTLVFATGATPRRLSVDGAAASNVFALKSLRSAQKLRDFLRHKPRLNVVIVGAGTIGLTMADVLTKLGNRVTVIEQASQILDSLDADSAERIENMLKTKSFRVLKRKKVAAYVLEASSCVAVHITPDNQTIAADMVLEAIGVQPNVELARKTGIQLGPLGAIRVDSTMKTSQLNMYAVGDCVELINAVTGKSGYYPRGSNAQKTGRIAGENIAGHYSRLQGVLGTTLLQCYDVTIGWTGVSEKEAKRYNFQTRTVEISAPSRARGYPGSEPLQIKLVFTREGKILGGQLIGSDGVTGRLQALALALHKQATLRDLATSDLAYHPPLSPVWDPLIIAARAGLRKLKFSPGIVP